jgi:hypothetical protein
MKKLHIQQIEKLALEKLPAPGSYTLPSPIGQQGIHYTIRNDPNKERSRSSKLIFCSGKDVFKTLPAAWTWRIQDAGFDRKHIEVKTLISDPDSDIYRFQPWQGQVHHSKYFVII